MSLQNAGFSGRDYLKHEDYAKETPKNQPTEMDFFKPLVPNNNSENEKEDDLPLIDSEEIKEQIKSDNNQIKAILEKAEQADKEYKEQSDIQQSENNNLPFELQNNMNDRTYKIRNKFESDARALRLPKFVINVKSNIFFGSEETTKALDLEDLLIDFKLTSEDKKIIFETSHTESQMITLDERNKDEWVPMVTETPSVIKNDFYEWFSQLNTSGKVDRLSNKVAEALYKLDSIDNGQILNYVKSVLKDKTNEDLSLLAQDITGTVKAFENKIKNLALAYKIEKFKDMIDTGEIFLQDAWVFPEKVMLTKKSASISKMLFAEEDFLNPFEVEVIKKIASLDNVLYWHKNLNHNPGFYLNGFINHYPDFIIKLESGKILLVETKGDQLANPESALKVKLGEYWQNLDQTRKYRYFMTFENQGVEGSIPVNKLIELIKKM